MSKTKRKAAPARTPDRIMVVYGIGEDKKPRAARFAPAEYKLARKAAKVMGLQVYEGTPPNVKELHKILSPGRIYASGSALVPNITRNQFDKLVEVLGAIEPKAPASASQFPLPSSWNAIAIGHLVLAQADAATDGWWPTLVQSVDDDMLRLHAIDFPEIEVVRHRSAVALLCTPEYVAPDLSNNVPPALPVSWDTLAAGHLVLAREERDEDGYWEALVLEIDGDVLTLKFRDYARQPKIKRHRTAVALLNPAPPQAP